MTESANDSSLASPSAAAHSSADEWSRLADADMQDADLGDRERPVILTRSAVNGLLVEQAERISSASVASSASVLALAGSLLGDAEREAQLDVSLEPAFFDASAEESDVAFSATAAAAAAARDASSGWNLRATPAFAFHASELVSIVRHLLGFRFVNIVVLNCIVLSHLTINR